MYIKTKIILNFLIILSFVLGVNNVYGKECFNDNFDQNTINENDWNFFSENGGQNSFRLENGNLIGEIYSEKRSFLIAKNFYNLFDYTINLEASNITGVDQNIVFKFKDINNFYILNIRFNDQYWPQVKGNVDLWKFDSSLSLGYEKLGTFGDLNVIDLSKGKFHKIKIDVYGSNIRVYFDSVLIFDIFDQNMFHEGSFGFYNWGGQYSERSTLNLFDNLVVGDQSCMVLKPKIIILPGLGASWNTNAIVYNQTVSDSDWKMTPFVKNYDGLINALKENGLEENKDFYVWNYDWRRPVSDIEGKLNSFINEKISSDEKVILIGHSLGGLVSRIWAEDNKNDSRLEKVINLAAPNLGSVNSYEIWNGGQISNLSNFSSIAFKILLKIQGLKTKTDMEAVRNYVPVVKDLLPTFSFITKNGSVLPNNILETNNSYLLDKNNMVGIGSTLKLFAGRGFNTAKSVILKENNIFDRVLGIWPDGRIIKTDYTSNGDGTVLFESANYGKDNFIEVNSNHGEIVGKTVNQVMTEIGLSQVDTVTEIQNLDNNLVFFVGSPVNYSVKCDDQSPVGDVDGFVVIKNNDYKSCQINLVGTGDGLIHVVTGNTNDNDWYYLEKNIKSGDNYIVKVDPSDGQIINDKNNISFLKSVISDDLNSLIVLNKNNKNLKEALKFLDKNQPRMVIRNVFEFRKNSDERFVSGKIIDNTSIWMSLIVKCSNKEANFGFKVVSNYQNLINSLVMQKSKKYFKVNENGAISYEKMDNLLKTVKTDLGAKDYANVCANNLVALNYGSEVLVKAYKKDDFKRWLLQDSNL